jgi:antitoxin component YwqK of YwqJK toxin-antitoxin module
MEVFMKKLALMLALCLVMFAAAGYAQEKEYTIDVDASYDNATGTYQDTSGKPITGLLKGYYNSGHTFYEYPFKNGIADGHYKRYYESGKIMREATYKNGNPEGIAKDYYENGRIWKEWNFKAGYREGLGKVHISNGAILEIYFKKEVIVSGDCIGVNGKRTPLTTPEISYLNNGESVECQ